MAYAVKDLFPGIRAKMGNRTDLDDQMPGVIMSTVWEFSQNYEFEELKTTGPTRTFTAGVSEYDKNYFTKDNEDWTDVAVWWCSLSTSVTNIGRNIIGRNIQVVETMRNISAPPMFWAQHGNKLFLGFSPDQAYPTYWKYQKRHPFSVDLVNQKEDIIYLPLEWQESVEYGAAMRLAASERAFDYQQKYHDMIFGDPKFVASGGKEGRPGLLFGLTSQQTRNKAHFSRQVKPTIAQYGR